MADFLPLSDRRYFLQRFMQLRQFLPSYCVLCAQRTQGGGLCAVCVADWHYRYKQVRWRCQRCKVAQLGGVAQANRYCLPCQQQQQAWDGLSVAFDYIVPLDTLIWRFKMRHQLRLAPVLAYLLHLALLRDGVCLAPNTVVTYIPSRPTAIQRRGFNPAAELARYVARYLGLSFMHGALGLTDTSEQQAQKHRSQQQRWHYSRHAFTWLAPSTPSSLVIVDDVLTTGSTLQGAAACARQQGVQQVYGMALARVPWSM